MAFSLLNIFKRKAKEEPAVEPTPAPRPAVEKSSAERLSKTVMPNSTRTVAPQAEPAFASPGSPITATMPSPVTPGPAAPRTVAFAPSEPPKPTGLPPAVAVQLEPTVERAVAIELSEIVGQMPPGWVRPLEGNEPSRRVLLRAAELERGMASGKPSVAIASIYEQVPEIFTRSVSSSETARVMLPFAKVLEEFAALHVRSDQRPEAAVPQVDTPFLKVTTEDSQRFGIAPTPIAAPSVRVEPATAETLAKAEPEVAYREKAVPGPSSSAAPMRIAVPANGNGNGNGAATPRNTPAAQPTSAPAAPARIPFKLTPNGTGVPATERVPASSGPSVPTSLPKAGAPARVPFKISAPSEQARPKTSEGWITKENLAADTTPAVPVSAAAPIIAPPADADGVKISLALAPIFRNLPPFQLLGDADEVASDARVEFPFSLVEPQLATGRVTLTPEQFAAGLPEEYRGMFNPGDSAATVSLPLQEVLKNLPSASLRMRDDQEEQEKGSGFATPFSAKADEDAKRFKIANAPIAKPVVAAPVPAAAPAPAPVVMPSPFALPKPVSDAAAAPISLPRVLPAPEPEPTRVSAPLRIASAPAASKGERTELQIALDTDDELDPKAVVAHIGKMPGVKGCAIIFEDGLSLAGNLPPEFNAEGISAMAPAMMQKIENHMGDSKLGALRAMTLSCANAAVTFLTHNNLCLAALHAKEELAADVRDRLAVAVQQLSKTYSQPA